MGYGILRIEKRRKNSVGGIAKENNRTNTNKEKWEQRNPGKMYLPASDIDWSKTEKNEFLVKSNNWFKSIQDEIDQLNLKKAVRKDAVVMLDYFVGISPEDADLMTDADIKSYFEDSLQFIQDKYGHVFNAVIHYDESTPHMHVVGVPITSDGRLSAKTLMGQKKDYIALQDEFYDRVSKKYGLKRGESAAETGREHISNMRLKNDTLSEEIKQKKEKKKELDEFIEKNNLENIIDETKKKYEAAKIFYGDPEELKYESDNLKEEILQLKKEKGEELRELSDQIERKKEEYNYYSKKGADTFLRVAELEEQANSVQNIIDEAEARAKADAEKILSDAQQTIQQANLVMMQREKIIADAEEEGKKILARKMDVLSYGFSVEDAKEILSDSTVQNLIDDTMHETCKQLAEKGIIQNPEAAYRQLDKKSIIDRMMSRASEVAAKIKNRMQKIAEQVMLRKRKGR